MESAMYGRMEVGRCISAKYGNIGCSGDVLALMDRKCSAKVSCEVRVPNQELDEIDTCDDEITKYLDAAYDCITGETS